MSEDQGALEEIQVKRVRKQKARNPQVIIGALEEHALMLSREDDGEIGQRLLELLDELGRALKAGGE